MRTPFLLLKTFILLMFAASLPTIIAWIFFDLLGAKIAVSLISVLMLGSAARSNLLLMKVLRPRTIQVGEYAVYAIEDPSSHVFATQSFFEAKPRLWITRGALSLLAPEEIKSLLDGMVRASRQGGLRFETAPAPARGD